MGRHIALTHTSGALRLKLRATGEVAQRGGAVVAHEQAQRAVGVDADALEHGDGGVGGLAVGALCDKNQWLAAGIKNQTGT
eukprot:SAG11_NODE_558_length_8540_cov_3.877147_13_plen_81_part_00